MTKSILLTGSTGMVGKGVLLECLESKDIEKVYAINRSSLGMKHPKLEEIIFKDFGTLKDADDVIPQVDACFHCMGVTSLGKSEDEYSNLTYNITKDLADVCYKINPDMTFIYVSGTGTDSSEKGRSMWARVKGKTENYLLNKGFAKAVMFRPGMILPEKGIRSRTGWYQFMYVLMTPFFPLLRLSNNVTTTSRIGQAMIKCMFEMPTKKHLENPDINQMVRL